MNVSALLIIISLKSKIVVFEFRVKESIIVGFILRTGNSIILYTNWSDI